MCRPQKLPYASVMNVRLDNVPSVLGKADPLILNFFGVAASYNLGSRIALLYLKAHGT